MITHPILFFNYMGKETDPDDPQHGTMVQTALDLGGEIVQTDDSVGPSPAPPIGPQDGSPVNPDKPEPPPS